jgi:hypothetical protein
MIRDVATVLGAFALATGVAEAFGTSNLGTALAFGQIGFALALVWVLLLGDGARSAAAEE